MARKSELSDFRSRNYAVLTCRQSVTWVIERKREGFTTLRDLKREYRASRKRFDAQCLLETFTE